MRENLLADNGEEQSLDVGLMEVLNSSEKEGMELPVKDADQRKPCPSVTIRNHYSGNGKCGIEVN